MAEMKKQSINCDSVYVLFSAIIATPAFQQIWRNYTVYAVDVQYALVSCILLFNSSYRHSFPMVFVKLQIPNKTNTI